MDAFTIAVRNPVIIGTGIDKKNLQIMMSSRFVIDQRFTQTTLSLRRRGRRYFPRAYLIKLLLL